MTFGERLFAAGYRSCIGCGWQRFNPTASGEDKICHGSFVPNFKYTGTYDAADRYYFPYYFVSKPPSGVSPSEFKPKGPIVGPEGISASGLKEALSKSPVLMALGLPDDYVVTQDDVNDCMWVKGAGENSVWGSHVAPFLSSVPQPPTQPPTKPPTQPPTQPPMQPPVNPPTQPAGLSSLEQRTEEVMSMLGAAHGRALQSLPSVLVPFTPSWATVSFIIRPLVKEFIASWRRAVERAKNG